MQDRSLRPLLILGATGALGAAFARACNVRGIPYHLMSRREVDLEDASSIDRALARRHPWAVINAAGYVRIDEAETDVEACMRINAVAPGVLAAACSRHDVRLVCFSSDLVFDGSHEALHRPYVESDTPAPLNVYGRSKADMEARVLHVLPETLVVRTAALFGTADQQSVVSEVMNAVRRQQPVLAALDEVVSPTYVVDLVNVTLDLLIDREVGIWHLANVGSVSYAELAQKLSEMSGADPDLVKPVPAQTLNRPARRPRYSVLASERAALMPHLEDALGRFLRDGEAAAAEELEAGAEEATSERSWTSRAAVATSAGGRP